MVLRRGEVDRILWVLGLWHDYKYIRTTRRPHYQFCRSLDEPSRDTSREFLGLSISGGGAQSENMLSIPE